MFLEIILAISFLMVGIKADDEVEGDENKEYLRFGDEVDLDLEVERTPNLKNINDQYKRLQQLRKKIADERKRLLEERDRNIQLYEYHQDKINKMSEAVLNHRETGENWNAQDNQGDHSSLSDHSDHGHHNHDHHSDHSHNKQDSNLEQQTANNNLNVKDLVNNSQKICRNVVCFIGVISIPDAAVVNGKEKVGILRSD